MSDDRLCGHPISQQDNTMTVAFRIAPVDSPAPHVTIETVTPDMAARWMATKAPNRRPQPSRIDQYARDMAAGRWALNGETVKFDRQGRCIDGQHRLAAVVEAGVPVTMMVVRGLPSNAIETVDAGRARQFADALNIKGESSAHALAAAAAWVWRYENGSMRDTNTISHRELADVLGRHPGLRDSVGKMKRTVAPPAALAFVHYMGSQQHPDLAEEYVHGIAHGTMRDGTGLGAHHPVFVLRERLRNEGQNRKSSLRRIEALALMVKAWNHLVAGRDVMSLRWRSQGPKAEEFPVFA
jgi:hypothetical protein